MRPGGGAEDLRPYVAYAPALKAGWRALCFTSWPNEACPVQTAGWAYGAPDGFALEGDQP